MINTLITLYQDRAVSTAAERYLLVYMLAVLIIISSLIIIFFVIFQKRKNKLLLDKIKQQQAFEEELSNTQIEIQEQTLKNIGQELHDNIGQLLSVANMQLSIMSTQVEETLREQFSETKNVVKESLSEVRALSRTLNSDVIINRGFQQSVESEIERLNKLKIVEATITINGNQEAFVYNKDSIILFRIFQEFISNTIKYASAKHLKIELNYQKDKLIMVVSDDGKGFDLNNIEKGSGLINMESRAQLIQSDFQLNSELDKGTELKLIYPYRKDTKVVL